MEYTLIRRAVRASIADGPDPDRDPELVPTYGQVTFTPVLAKGESIQVQDMDTGEVTTVVLPPITARISDGIILHRGEEGIKLFAGGESANPPRVRWRATFHDMQADGKPFTLAPVVFDAIPGGEVDLTLAAPLAGAPELIVRGPQGERGSDGADGTTPHIESGRWWIGDVDTMIPATGPKGDQGDRGPEGRVDVSWEGDVLTVNDVASPPLTGPKGDPGEDGTGFTILGSVPSASSLPTGASPGDGYLAEDTGRVWVWSGTGWVDLGTIQGPKGDKGDTGDQGPPGTTQWAGIQGKPASYPPESHDHTASQISDATTVGRSVLTASSAAAARQAIGAGTSSLTLGTSSSTAAAGDHTHSQYATTTTVNGVSSRVTTLENAQPIIVSSLPSSPLPGRIYLVTE